MFRFSLIVGVYLIFGITAKPYKSWNKLTDGTAQDTVMSIDDKGKTPWGVEVEPPEDMDETLYDIDPSMMIWKSMTGSSKKDMDELYHPSVADLLKVQSPHLDALPAADTQADPSQENIKYNEEPDKDRDDIDHPVFKNVALEEPEQDWDEIYHAAREELNGYLAPLIAEYKGRAELRVAHTEPEKDKDDLYHHEDNLYHHVNQHPPVQMEPLRREVRVHLQPEEDRDALYHKDLPELIPYQDHAPVFYPSERKHSEPEEDLDGLYHQ